MASEPPDGISTVDLAERFLRAGMLMLDSTTAPSLVSSLTSVSMRRLMRPSDSTTGVKARPTPNSLKMTESLPSLSTTGIGIFAAGQELGRLAGDGRQVGLGQRADQAVALQRAQGLGDLCVAAGEVGGDARVAERGGGRSGIVVARMPLVGSDAGRDIECAVPRPAAAVCQDRPRL